MSQSSIAMWTYSQPTVLRSRPPRRVSAGLARVARDAGDAFAGAALDAPEFLDVDVDQLARPLALIAHCRLEAEPAELAHPDPGQDPRHRRERHVEGLGDLRAREAQPSQRRDRFDPLRGGAMRDPAWRRRTIKQPELALERGTAPTHLRAQRTLTSAAAAASVSVQPCIHNPTAELPTPFQTERRVSVKLHPVSSLD